MCYTNRDIFLASGRTADELYNSTMDRLYELERLQKYNLHVVWEHDFRNELRTNPELKAMYDMIDVATPLDPRADCLRGGRTEPFKHYHKCSKNEEIVHVDVVSLYPWVMKNCAFPVGYPEIITSERIKNLPWRRAKDNPFFGLGTYKVLPPRNLFRTVLYYRNRRKRLTFPLCRICAEDERHNQTECRHTDDERAWIGGYTHAEINKALECGYIVLEAYEVFLWLYFNIMI